MKRSWHLERRTFLRGVGASLALPSLECMYGSLQAADAKKSPKRFLAVHVALGMHPGGFQPVNAGRDYEMPELLQPLKEHRDELTVFTGLDHPGVTGGHRGIVTFLTGTDVFGQPGYDFKNTVSLDQVYAGHVGSETRFASMQLATSGNRSASSWDVSWTHEGTALQPMSLPRHAFNRLFTNEKIKDDAVRAKIYDRRISLLDRVLGEAKSLEKKLGANDREKLDEYLTSVREVESRIEKAESWAHKPKPEVSMGVPKFNSNKDPDMFENMSLMYRLIALAFETDSTRSIVLQIPANNTVFNQFDGVDQGYHGLSHHGKQAEKVKQLLTIEREHTKHLAAFLDRMKTTKEAGSALLDSTTVLFGSGLGNASSHSNRALPVLVAGGGFNHGSCLSFKGTEKQPLAKLYVSLLQNLGVEEEGFAGHEGTLPGFA